MIRDTDSANRFYVRCFFDSDGELREEGIYEVDSTCTDRVFTAKDLYNEINGYFGGEKIILKNIIHNGFHCTLKKVE